MTVRPLPALQTLFAAALVAASLTPAAHAEGLYLGGSIGSPHFPDGVNGIPGNGTGVSGKLFAGFDINPNFEVEAGVATLGHINNANGTVNAHGFYLDGVGLLPLGANFSLLGSVGLARVNLNTSGGDDAGLGLKLGLGAEYAISKVVSLRGEFESYRPAEFGTHPNVGQYTLGVRVGF